MHEVTIPDHITRRVLNRRGKLHIYDRLAGRSTALVVVDLQNIFMLPGMPLEVPCAREIVPKVNRLAAAVRRAGGAVAWVQLTGEDQNGDDLISLRIGRPADNPHFGAPHILVLDNVSR
jgi:ureidoacrylate peracid hydrolase